MKLLLSAMFALRRHCDAGAGRLRRRHNLRRRRPARWQGQLVRDAVRRLHQGDGRQGAICRGRLGRRRRARREGEIESAGRRARHAAAVHSARRGGGASCSRSKPTAAARDRRRRRRIISRSSTTTRTSSTTPRRSRTPPKTFDDLLDPKFKGKIQYSTPGQAGDGTAVMLQVIHAFGVEGRRLRLPEEAAGQQRRAVRPRPAS